MATSRPHRGANRQCGQPAVRPVAGRRSDGDWLDLRDDIDGAPPPLRTTVTVETPRTIISHNRVARHPVRPVDQSVSRLRTWLHLLLRAPDPCLSRPVAGAGFRKPAVRQADRSRRCCARELAQAGLCGAGRWRSAPTPIRISRSSATWRITRSVIEVLAETDHPLTITTKSDRVLRDHRPARADGGEGAGGGGDIGHLARPAGRADGRAARAAPRTAAGRGAARWPRRASPSMCRSRRSSPRSPIMRSKHLIERAAEAGARAAFFIPVRLPHEVAPLFRAWLDDAFPRSRGAR